MKAAAKSFTHLSVHRARLLKLCGHALEPHADGRERECLALLALELPLDLDRSFASVELRDDERLVLC